jgi:L-rhamnose mutarotase
MLITGNRLCMVVEADASFDAAAKRASEAANPESIAWEEKMDVYQQPLPWANPGEKWVEAELIFDLAAQP